MYLILDFGNTLVKEFLYQKESLVTSTVIPYNTLSAALLSTQKKHPKITHILVSDVWGKGVATVSKIFKGIPLFNCTLALKMPFTTTYESPKTLGADRIALLAAMRLAYPKQNVLGIDLGSCITYDYLDAEGCHRGGSISPGFQMRYKSVHAYTGKLPKLEPKKAHSPLAVDTENSLHAGIYFGILHEIEGQIEYYKSRFENLTVIFVGGDAQRLPMPFKNGIFAPENFSANGLRHILEINI